MASPAVSLAFASLRVLNMMRNRYPPLQLTALGVFAIAGLSHPELLLAIVRPAQARAVQIELSGGTCRGSRTNFRAGAGFC